VRTSLASAESPRSTGKERDAESGNDYMFARYYNSATGRFLSPDWSAKEEPVPYAKLDNPQTLNLYAYVGNNPVGRADADGHDFAGHTAMAAECKPGMAACMQAANANLKAEGAAVVVAAVAAGAGEVAAFGRVLLGYVAANGAKIEQAVEDVVETAPKLDQPQSPSVHPSEIMNKTPSEIHSTATDKGLIPKGPDPQNGKGAYVDPVTGEQRVLVHPKDGHAHVNNPAGKRLGPDGSVVPKKSDAAHLPIKKDD